MTANPAAFLELILKSSALIALSALAARMMWRGSAPSRAFIWLAAFVGLLILPATFLVPSFWTFQVGPPSPSFDLVPISAPDSVGTHAAVNIFSSNWLASHWFGLAVGVWLTGFVVLMLRWLFSAVWLQAMENSPIDDTRILKLASCLNSSSSRSISLRMSDRLPVPCTWGHRSPIILLPSEAVRWSDEHLEAVLRHEYAHIERKDFLSRKLVRFVCALYWPNPLVWLAARALRTAQEEACDDAVLGAGVDAQSYAWFLVESARSAMTFRKMPAQVIAMASPSRLENRVVSILDHQRDRRPVTWLMRVMTGMIFASLLSASALAQVGDANSQEGEGTRRKAREIIIPKLDVVDVTLDTLVRFIEMRARSLDPVKTKVSEINGQKAVTVSEGGGVRINLRIGPASPQAVQRFTFSKTDISVYELLRFIAETSKLNVKYSDDAITLEVPTG